MSSVPSTSTALPSMLVTVFFPALVPAPCTCEADAPAAPVTVKGVIVV